jgi:hypothetical protein
MSTLRLIGAAAILSVIGTAPALAQAVIQEPGYCAFFYPNANCQNKGPGNPYTDPNFNRSHFATAGGYGDQTVAMTPKRRVRKPAGMY